ncbi:hypothetical protein BN1012_Phect936 [Candidatus Phaeomarinobacter ectocarpi]|uniref:Uncharacterized protein n=1 Tax=Candidatus Phaeomarinibacter ectocarpi TaxID=1458461 RepID=X5ML46_9HYPH|nr:hypothetical protein BN1012_Phect936 [Candidatus Phaeomarinobacter ectocarpi]
MFCVMSYSLKESEMAQNRAIFPKDGPFNGFVTLPYENSLAQARPA